MKSGWTVVCLMVALSVGLVAGSAAASPVLNSEEMGALEGGCQRYCVQRICGVYQNCSPGVGQFCDPEHEEPSERCDGEHSSSQVVQECIGLTDNKKPCTPGTFQGCGTLADCKCKKVWPSSVYTCYTENSQSYRLYVYSPNCQ